MGTHKDKIKNAARKARNGLVGHSAAVSESHSNKLDEALNFIHKIKNGLAIQTGENEALTSLFTGQKMYVDTRDTSVAPHLMLDGHWEPEITKVFRSQLKPTDTVLDIGANLGYFGIVAGTELGPDGSIHFFEPNPTLTKLIVKSVSVNGLGQMSSINTVAVGDKVGSMNIYFNDVMAGSGNVVGPPDTGIKDTGSVDFGTTTKVRTPVVTVDDYCATRGIKSVGAIKIDVEGYEYNIYKGMKKTIKNSPDLRLFLEFTPRSYDDPEGFFKQIKSDFRQVYCIDTSADGMLVPIQDFKDLDQYLRGWWCMLLAANDVEIDKSADAQSDSVVRVSAKGEPVRLSTDIVNADFDTEWYRAWAKRLGLKSKFYHCKFWEQAMLYEALKRYGMLQPGKRGIGFGVGKEQLVSVFANEGASITATDQPPEGDALAWDNGQLASGKDSLFYKDLVSRNVFDKNVQFENHDMNILNKSYINQFDFAWSNCVIGHVGSMKLSEEYLKRSAQYIKDGGVHVFTTELNISSLTETVADNSGTIIWRLSDLHRVFNEMLDHDMVALPFKLRLVEDPSDRNIYFDVDELAYEEILGGAYDGSTNVTKIPFSNYAITQIQLVFVKKHLSPAKKMYYKQLYRMDYRSNTSKLRQFIHSQGDINDYATKYGSTKLDIKPATGTKSIKLRPGEVGQVSITYTNKTEQPFFLYGLHTPLHVPPLALATANPVNRASKSYVKTWFSDNRPTVTFKPVYKAKDFKDRCHGYHRTLPGEKFTYTFDVKAPKKKGSYSEDFCLVLEGMGDIPDSQFTLKMSVS